MDVTLPAKGPARRLGRDHPGGDACFGPRRATNTHHKLPTENSAQIPWFGKLFIGIWLFKISIRISQRF